MGGAGAEAVQLAVEEKNVASLRDEDALPGQVLLETDGTAIGAEAHGAGGVEADEDIARGVTDGDGLRLDLGSVNAQREIAFDVHVNRASFEGDGQRATGFEDGEMRGTANADLAAFHKIDARGAGLGAHVAAAA